MIVIAYLRLGKSKKGIRMAVSRNKNRTALLDGVNYRHKRPIPTKLIKLKLELPDDFFEAAMIVLEQNIKKSVPATEVKITEESPEDEKGEPDVLDALIVEAPSEIPKEEVREMDEAERDAVESEEIKNAEEKKTETAESTLKERILKEMVVQEEQKNGN